MATLDMIISPGVKVGIFIPHVYRKRVIDVGLILKFINIVIWRNDIRHFANWRILNLVHSAFENWQNFYIEVK